MAPVGPSTTTAPSARGGTMGDHPKGRQRPEMAVAAATAGATAVSVTAEPAAVAMVSQTASSITKGAISALRRRRWCRPS